MESTCRVTAAQAVLSILFVFSAVAVESESLEVKIEHGFKIYLAYNFFADNNICMVWSQLAELRSTPALLRDSLCCK